MKDQFLRNTNDTLNVEQIAKNIVKGNPKTFKRCFLKYGMSSGKYVTRYILYHGHFIILHVICHYVPCILYTVIFNGVYNMCHVTTRIICYDCNIMFHADMIIRCEVCIMFDVKFIIFDDQRIISYDIILLFHVVIHYVLCLSHYVPCSHQYNFIFHVATVCLMNSSSYYFHTSHS